MMSPRLCCFLVLFLHAVLVLAGASSRNFGTSYGAFAVNDQSGTLQNPKSLQTTQSSNKLAGIEKRVEIAGKAAVEKEEVNKIGSRPPNCEHKCYGCDPCEAIQVPTSSSQVRVQYTNYVPEGWKCKCGPTFYSP